MIVCPVCEHAQPQGVECDVCGKRLVQGATAIPFVPPVDGLEPTRHADVDAGEDRLGEIDPTRHAPVDPPADPAPDIEPTRAPPVDVDVEPAPDVERIQGEIPGDGPTPLPAFVTCRYCRTPALPDERVCGRCGMRLPIADAARDSDAAPSHLCGCGATVRGDRCPSCGSRRA